MKNLTPALFALLLFIAGCTKQGPQGPAGPTGASGTTGPTGASANTNVATYYATINSNQWSVSGTLAYANITLPAVTQNILDSGAVIVYRLGTNGSTQYQEALPYTTTSNVSFIDYLQPGAVQIDIQYPGTITSQVTEQFKIVVITGL